MLLEFLKEIRFKHVLVDLTIFSNKEGVIVRIHVNDLLITRGNELAIQKLKS